MPKPAQPTRAAKIVAPRHAETPAVFVEEEVTADSGDEPKAVTSGAALDGQSGIPTDSVVSVAVDMSIWGWNARPDTPDFLDTESLVGLIVCTGTCSSFPGVPEFLCTYLFTVPPCIFVLEFSYAVKGLVDRMLPSIMLVELRVSNGGELYFERDREPIAPPVDRHGAKLVRKKVKRRKQHYATAMKTSKLGSYAPSRASSRTASRFGGSRFGGSLAPTASVRSAVLTAKMAKLAFPLDSSNGADPHQNASWLGSQHSSTNNNHSKSSPLWPQGMLQDCKDASAPSSMAGTVRLPVDFAEIQRRAEIERDIHMRESLKHSTSTTTRRGEIRLKLRSLADPTISVEKEEALAIMAAKVERSRRQPSRQASRRKGSGITIPALSPLNIKPRDPVMCSRAPAPATNAEDENVTYRTEDYEGLTSDVVLQDKAGELLVGENCFLVARKPRQELLLDLQMQSSVEPRVKVLPTPRKEADASISVPEQSMRNLASRQSRSRGPPARVVSQNSPEGPSGFKASTFEGQTGSFESLPSFTIDPKKTPLAKGVALKLVETPSAVRPSPSKAPHATNRKLPSEPMIQENITNARLEKDLDVLLKAPHKYKSAVTTSLSDPTPSLQASTATPARVPGASSPSLASSSSAKTSGAEYPVLPRHIHNGYKDLPSFRIRTPACPNRLSRKASSRSAMHEDLTDGNASMDSLFSLNEQRYNPPASLPKVKYRREFPSPPHVRVRLFGPLSLESDWAQPAPSPFPFASMSATIEGKR